MSGDPEVAVIGAGPAGAVAALVLSRLGVRVTVLEKTPPPRYKTCGGGLVLRARKWQTTDISAAIERECTVCDLNHLDAGLSFRLEDPEPLVTMTMRSELDRHLLEAALEEGAEIVTPCRLHSIDRESGRLRLRTDRGSITASFVVAADGAGGRTASAAGWPPISHRVPALESEIEVDSTLFARFADSARFDFGLVAHGYAWVFPKRTHLSVGCLSTRLRGRALRITLEEYLEHLDLSDNLGRQDHGFTIPARPRSKQLAHGGVLLTGDAAGLADPVTYEGISYAILSGRLAAEAIASNLDKPDLVTKSYQLRLAKEILPQLRLGRFLASILFGRPRLRRSLFRLAGQPMTEAMGQVFAGRTTYSKLLLNPSNYLQLIRHALRAV